MTDKYPMALYPPKGEMLIVNDENEHAAALSAHWEALTAPVEPPPVPAPDLPVAEEPAEAHAAYDPVFAELTSEIWTSEPDAEPETFDDTGAPVKRGPGRPRKVVP